MKLLSRRVFLSYDLFSDRFPIWPRRLWRTELPGILFAKGINEVSKYCPTLLEIPMQEALHIRNTPSATR